MKKALVTMAVLAVLGIGTAVAETTAEYWACVTTATGAGAKLGGTIGSAVPAAGTAAGAAAGAVLGFAAGVATCGD